MSIFVTNTLVIERNNQKMPFEVVSKNLREQIINNSPQENEDYFVVPKVIE